MRENKSTTIQILMETRDELEALGSNEETYDKIINRLIKAYKEGNRVTKYDSLDHRRALEQTLSLLDRSFNTKGCPRA